MKLFITEDPNLGTFTARLAKAELKLAANKLQWAIVDEASSAELVAVIGSMIPSNSAFTGCNVAIATAESIFANPLEALKMLATKAKLWQPKVKCNAQAYSATIFRRVVAITACPTGVAHTFMAAEAMLQEAKKRGWHCKVETRGSVGVGNPLTPAEIEAADFVVVAADIEIDLSQFSGKRMYRTTTGSALKKTAQELDKALNLATVYRPENNKIVATSTQQKKGVYKHLLTGISYMLPMVVAGGLIIALSFAIGGINQEGALAKALGQIGGSSALGLMVPLLSGYIAYSIADRPGLVPGLIGGMLATTIGAGFLGGIVSGYLAGYVVFLLAKYIKLSKSFDALKPILILPFISSLVTGLAMLFIIGAPVANLMLTLERWLSGMQMGNAILLGTFLGGMMCTDMGGPINKVAYAFGVGLLSAQQYAPMAAVMAGGMVPPLAMSLATFMAKNKFSANERQSGKAAFVLGLCFISEGAIPFAARDPFRVLPSCILGGAVTGGLVMAVGSKLMAPHGGVFVLAIPSAITPVAGYLLSIFVGTVLAGVTYALIKKTTLSHPETSLAPVANQ